MFPIILDASCNRCICASMHVIDANSKLKNSMVIAKDGANAEAAFCHLTGDEPVFNCSGASRACVVLL